MVTTARACGLDDRAYVEWLLTEMPADPTLRAKGADYARYLPWSDAVPESCRAAGAHFLEDLEGAGEPVIDLGKAAVPGSD